MDEKSINKTIFRISKDFFKHYRKLHTKLANPDNIKNLREIKQLHESADWEFDEHITRHKCMSFILEFKNSFIHHARNLTPPMTELNRIDGVILKNLWFKITIDDDINYYYVKVEQNENINVPTECLSEYDKYTNITRNVLLEMFESIEYQTNTDWLTLTEMDKTEESITLLSALAACYEHASIKEPIGFEISFPDVTRTICFGKQYNKTFNCLEYFVHETYAPCITCTEESFVANLTKCSGISCASQHPTYKIKQLY